MRQNSFYRSGRRVDAEIQSGGVVLHVLEHVVVRDVVVIECVVAEVVRRRLEILLRREPPGRAKKIWWCFDENVVPAVDHATRFWDLDAVGVALGLAEAAHHPFPRRVAELVYFFHVYADPYADDLEIGEVCVLPVELLVRRLRV